MTLRADNRGLAIDLIVLVISVLLAAMFIVLLNEPIEQVIAAGRSNAETQAAASGWQYLEDAWAIFPLLALLLALVQFIVASQFKAQRGR